MGQGACWISASQTPLERGKKRKRQRIVSWLRREEGRGRGAEERAIKTLTSNLVYCVEKSHMHSRPTAGPHRSPCDRGHQLLASSPFLHRSKRGCAGAAAATMGPSASLLEPLLRGRVGGQAIWQGKDTETPHFK